MTRKLSIITAVAGLALVAAAPATGKGQGVSEEPWKAALQARSEALNAKHGLGDSQRTVDTYLLALEARSQALNAKHGLGGSVQGTATRSSYEQALQARSEGLNRIYEHLRTSAPASVVTSERATSTGSSRYQEALMLRSEELNRRNELGDFAPRYMDAGERAIRVGTVPTVVPDAFERAVANRGTDGFVAGDDFVRIDPSDLPTFVATPTSSPSGNELEWPQLGIGFGIGIVLMIGIALMLRFTRVRPLAH